MKEVRTERGGVRRRCESGEGAEMLGLQRSVGRPYLSASTMGWTMSAQLDLIPACVVQRGYLVITLRVIDKVFFLPPPPPPVEVENGG